MPSFPRFSSYRKGFEALSSNNGKTRKYLEKDSWVRDMIADAKMIKACELAEKYQGRDSYSEIYKAIKKVKE